MFRIRKIDKVSMLSLPNIGRMYCSEISKMPNYVSMKTRRKKCFFVKTGYVFKMLTESWYRQIYQNNIMNTTEISVPYQLKLDGLIYFFIRIDV